MIEFFIPGEPVPKARMRVRLTRGRLWRQTPEETVRWETYLKTCAGEYAPETLIDEAFRMEMHFILTKPPSLPKKRRFPDRKPDWSNLVKSVEDALEGVIYTNDSRCVEGFVTKRYGEKPGVRVKIELMSEVMK